MRGALINNSEGFTFIELLMVFVIMGALASIAIPHYTGYKERAQVAQCEANRYHIEMEESAYYIEHNVPNLKIDDLFSCPSGGVYVWLVSDPDDPDYPKIGCSIHYAGPEIDIPATPEPEVQKPEKPEKPKKPKK